MILKSLLHVGKLALERRLEEEADGHLSGASSCLLSNRPVLGPPTKEQNDALLYVKRRETGISAVYMITGKKCATCWWWNDAKGRFLGSQHLL